MGKLLNVTGAALLLCAAPLATQAATAISFSGLSGAEYDSAGVYVLGDVNFTADTDDGGGMDDILFQLWDDFVVKFETTYSLAVGTSGSFHFEVYYPGLVGTSAQGVGLYVTDNGFYAEYIDPYDVPHYSDPSECQVDCGPAPVPLPAAGLLLAGGLGLMGALRRGLRRKA
ncbi:hypothetical protein V8J36_09645 [Frigidibacter sp. MR17.14]|uniref:hypothetical protein n=1 Tax=Frigidibacter sp. MR17.14 TaxID=3126509 RepID=UPI003012AC1C